MRTSAMAPGRLRSRTHRRPSLSRGTAHPTLSDGEYTLRHPPRLHLMAQCARSTAAPHALEKMRVRPIPRKRAALSRPRSCGRVNRVALGRACDDLRQAGPLQGPSRLPSASPGARYLACRGRGQPRIGVRSGVARVSSRTGRGAEPPPSGPWFMRRL
jgi:hypothetical protein